MKTIEIQITHPVGLHARPAALFVQTSQKFESKVGVGYKDKKVNAKSMLGLLSLGVTKDAVITIMADGSDEDEAIDALKQLVEDNFGEE